MNNHEIANEAQGAEVAAKVNDLDIDTIEKWISKDISVCLSLLNAINTDKDLRRMMATFLKGRFNNAQQKQDPAQINIPGI